MDTKINFDFVSPEELIVSSEVDMVLIPAKEGDAGILPNHAPYMTVLRQGIVEVTFDKDNIKSYLVEGGFADVTPDKITILAESSLNLTDINKSALLVELDSIEEKITNASDLDREILIERKSLMENFN
ncbi:ATP synthase F1 subunit epsilon [Hyphomicrobiales bacterium]|jgi:F-type H+-transporting ATPase subunit epsilon|nr:ATP synthase F1 subunit epsilon [Hyphomicrobiales bacterium]MDA8893173.1 ATP synthase F1 subunit epsilon [Hyphomicrobiales bacterium]|tara:strand:- start:8223 stop:8609 length:387 start_codon:yes stop_codon:yes gene_type:complete